MITYKDQIRYWGPMRTGSRVVTRFLQSIGFEGHHSHNLEWNGEEQLWVSIRNPYWRAVSWWILRHGIHHWIDGEGVTHYPERVSWEDWVMSDNEYLYYSNEEEDHWDTMVQLKYYNIEPTYLIRSENVYEDLMKIPFVRERMTDEWSERLKERGEDWTIHYLDEYKDLDYSTLYTQEIADRVWKLKEKETFGLYEKDSWKVFR